MYICICNLGTWAGSIHVRGAHYAYISNFNCSVVLARRGGSGRVLMYLIIDSTPSYERWMNLQYILKFLKYIICIDYSVENKILFFLNSLFLNSCSLKYYRQRGAAAATASRVTHLPVLYCDQHEFNQSYVYHSLHSEIIVYNPTTPS